MHSLVWESANRGSRLYSVRSLTITTICNLYIWHTKLTICVLHSNMQTMCVAAKIFWLVLTCFGVNVFLVFVIWRNCEDTSEGRKKNLSFLFGSQFLWLMRRTFFNVHAKIILSFFKVSLFFFTKAGVSFYS